MPPGDYAVLLCTTGRIVHTQGRGNKGRETQREGMIQLMIAFQERKKGK